MLQETPPQKTNRKYKDSFFRHLFTEDISRLQELYHRLHPGNRPDKSNS